MTEVDDGTFYLERLSVTGDSDDEFDYEEVPVDDMSSLATSDLMEDWDKTIDIIERQRRDGKIEANKTLRKTATPEMPASMLQRPEVADDFVRNFLRRNGLQRTMECFQTEWYERKQKGKLDNMEIYAVPDALQSLMLLTDEVKRLKVESEKYRSAAAVAKESYVKVIKERDFHRMHHLRIVQEKNRLVTDIKRLREHYRTYEPTLRSMKSKYETAIREKALTKLQRDKAVGQVTSLQAALHNSNDNKSQMGGGGRKEVEVDEPGPTHKELRRQRELHNNKDKKSASSADSGANKRFPNDSAFPVDTRVNPLLALVKGPPQHMVRNGGVRQHGTIRASSKPVSAVALHPRKPLAVTAHDDGLWKMWPVPSGNVIMTGQGHTDWVSDVDFDVKGTMLASSSGDRTVKLWNLEEGSCVQTFESHTQAVWGVSWHHTSHFLASCSMDKTIKVFDVQSERCRMTLRGHTDSVNSVQFLPFGNTLLSGSADKTISMWDARTKICAHTFFGHMHSINDATFTMKGDAVVSCDSYGHVIMWDVRTIQQLASYDLGPHPCNGVAIDATNHVIACASNDSSVKMIEVGTGQVSSMPGHDDACNCVVFDLTAAFLLSGGADGMLRVWS